MCSKLIHRKASCRRLHPVLRDFPSKDAADPEIRGWYATQKALNAGHDNVTLTGHADVIT